MMIFFIFISISFQVYFNSLQQNLESLIEFFKTNDTKTAGMFSYTPIVTQRTAIHMESS